MNPLERENTSLLLSFLPSVQSLETVVPDTVFDDRSIFPLFADYDRLTCNILIDDLIALDNDDEYVENTMLPHSSTYGSTFCNPQQYMQEKEVLNNSSIVLTVPKVAVLGKDYKHFGDSSSDVSSTLSSAHDMDFSASERYTNSDYPVPSNLKGTIDPKTSMDFEGTNKNKKLDIALLSNNPNVGSTTSKDVCDKISLYIKSSASESNTFSNSNSRTVVKKRSLAVADDHCYKRGRKFRQQLNEVVNLLKRAKNEQVNFTTLRRYDLARRSAHSLDNIGELELLTSQLFAGCIEKSHLLVSATKITIPNAFLNTFDNFKLVNLSQHQISSNGNYVGYQEIANLSKALRNICDVIASKNDPFLSLKKSEFSDDSSLDSATDADEHYNNNHFTNMRKFENSFEVLLDRKNTIIDSQSIVSMFSLRLKTQNQNQNQNTQFSFEVKGVVRGDFSTSSDVSIDDFNDVNNYNKIHDFHTLSLRFIRNLSIRCDCQSISDQLALLTNNV